MEICCLELPVHIRGEVLYSRTSSPRVHCLMTSSGIILQLSVQSLTVHCQNLQSATTLILVRMNVICIMTVDFYSVLDVTCRESLK